MAHTRPAHVADPDAPLALYRQGCALWSAGRHDAAIAALDEALLFRPDFAEALAMGGYMLGAMGKREAALRFYTRALELDSSSTVAWLNAGKLLFDMARMTEAREAFETATRLGPDDPDGWNCLAGALRELGQMSDSLAAAGRALTLRADFPEAAINAGIALLKLDRMQEALEIYNSASTRCPDDGAAHCGRGHALRNLGRFDEALAAFETAVALGNYEAIGGRGCLHLTLGDFERGWEGYEARWYHGKAVAEQFGARFPTWSGPKDRARTQNQPRLDECPQRVLVFNDHGLGDSIQFVRYLPMMAAAGVETTFVCPARLRRLFGPTIPARFVETPPAETFDAQIAISSLPRAFGTRLETIPAETPYLRPEPNLVEEWAERLGPAGFKVGIVWQGNADPEVDRARSIPLAAFAPLAAIPRVRLIALQKGFGEKQLDTLPEGMRVERLGAAFDAGPDAFVDAAAVMAHCNLVVTCDTSIAHLAGALARPVWVALKSDAEWRWMTERSDSPWYPTLRLFRQARRGIWNDVFEAMASELARLVAARFPARTLTTPTSPGDLIDKITILRLKFERIGDERKRANVGRELALLDELAATEALVGGALEGPAEKLAEVNAKLWEIEDSLRLCERAEDFGPRFVALARAVYVANDERAALKRHINDMWGSALVEEKSYA